MTLAEPELQELLGSGGARKGLPEAALPAQWDSPWLLGHLHLIWFNPVLLWCSSGSGMSAYQPSVCATT